VRFSTCLGDRTNRTAARTKPTHEGDGPSRAARARIHHGAMLAGVSRRWTRRAANGWIRTAVRRLHSAALANRKVPGCRIREIPDFSGFPREADHARPGPAGRRATRGRTKHGTPRTWSSGWLVTRGTSFVLNATTVRGRAPCRPSVGVRRSMRPGDGFTRARWAALRRSPRRCGEGPSSRDATFVESRFESPSSSAARGARGRALRSASRRRDRLSQSSTSRNSLDAFASR
jgi:hypothetical protein